MKIRITLVAIALLGLITGIAFAGPLVVSELDVKPWIDHVQGPTADFEVETIFANFTVLDPKDPASGVDVLAVQYQLWVNVTNPSDVNADLLHADLLVAEKITAYSGYPVFDGNSSGGSGWDAKGAFVDGIWYNLTWVGGKYPYFDGEGNLAQSPFPPYFLEGYWMEGVQVYERCTNGEVTATYLNMNGTWTDVTGRIVVDRPKSKDGQGFTADGFVIDNWRAYQTPYVPDFAVTVYSGVNETQTSVEADNEPNVIVDYLPHEIYVPSGEGYFDDYFEAGESRILLLEGVRKIDSVWGNNRTIDILNSGCVDLKVTVDSSADRDFVMENNTMQDTWSITTELKTVELTKINNSYIYNLDLLETYDFTVDEWNAEVLLDPR